CEGCTIENNRLINCGLERTDGNGDGICFAGGVNITVKANTVTNVKRDGIVFDHAAGKINSNVRITENHVLFDDNRIFSPLDPGPPGGIWVEEASQVIINGNTVTILKTANRDDNYIRGIAVSASPNSIIEHNTVVLTLPEIHIGISLTCRSNL